MDAPPATRLLAFARELQRASTFHELLAITRAELVAALGYAHAWLMVAETEDFTEVRLLEAAGAIRDAAWEHAPVLRIDGDAMMEEIASSDRPVVVEDARTDPRTNKALVEAIGNRTIINVPLRLLDKPFGALGTGTFGDEGCRPPTPAQLDYLIGMAGQLAVAAGRIRWLEERKRADERLRATEEQFRQSQKMEAIGRLAGGVAHDFNNLLSVILSYTDLLLEEAEAPSSWRYDLTEIRKASERAAELTRQLLAFGRQAVVVPQVVDLNEVVARTHAMLRRIIGADIELETVAGDALARIESDPGLVEQVLVNLIVNARDAMPEGGRILVETQNVVLDQDYVDQHTGATVGPHVMLAVSDTGCGMDKATMDRIFEPFFTTKEKGRGTGLGLSMVYGLVKQSGGSIWVYSEPGNGSAFKLYFPATDAPVRASAPPEAPSVARRGTETVLLVEDEEQLRAVAREVLERHGYRVLEANDPGHALWLAATHDGPIELLLTDVVMPRMTGGELAERLSAVRPETAILYMSGYTETSIVRHRGVQSGFALLAKPITPRTLLCKVREVLDAAAAARSPEH